MSALAAVTFDYAALEPALADDARAVASRIRGRLRTVYRDTGRDLIQIKDRIGHGQFGAWLKAEFDMTERAAENYMNAARWLEGKSESVSDLPATAVYALAAPSAPVAAVNEVVAAIEAGTKLPTHAIRSMLAEALEAERKAKAEAAKTEEQRQEERKARESRAARQARNERERQAQQENQQRAEQVRVERWMPLAQRVAAALDPQDFRDLTATLTSNADWDNYHTLLRLLRELAQPAQ